MKRARRRWRCDRILWSFGIGVVHRVWSGRAFVGILSHGLRLSQRRRGVESIVSTLRRQVGQSFQIATYAEAAIA